MASLLTLDDVRLSGKTVLVRVDVNSPLNPVTGGFLDDTRLREIMPTLRRLADAKVVLLAHQSRPGKSDFTTTEKHADLLGVLMGRNVMFTPHICDDTAIAQIRALKIGDILFLNNVRMHDDEISMKKSSIEVLESSELVTKLAAEVDAFVYDAFACAHRNSPTISGFGGVLPSIAGSLMEKEINSLSSAIYDPLRPYSVILGGVKCDDSVAIASKLLERKIVDTIIPVGVVGNLFLWADGIDIGEGNKSFILDALDEAFDNTWEMCKGIIQNHSDRLLLPVDVAIEAEGRRVPLAVSELPTQHSIYDIGIASLMNIRDKLLHSASILWNGPASYFEKPEFAFGTIEILNLCVETDAYVIIGGGHTSALVSQRGVADKLGHNSTGGGACLNFLAGKPLPALTALEHSNTIFRTRLDEFGLLE